jgi:putative acetyltransferase
MFIRIIEKKDNAAIAEIIKKVMTEYGATGAGFSINDSEVVSMFESYQNKAVYFVLDLKGQILGGGGVGPLIGSDPSICELKKMYFLPEARGKGLGKALIKTCLLSAKALGYKTMYLETYKTMAEAQSLYKKMGFTKIANALGNTGHNSCDSFYSIDL